MKRIGDLLGEGSKNVWRDLFSFKAVSNKQVDET